MAQDPAETKKKRRKRPRTRSAADKPPEGVRRTPDDGRGRKRTGARKNKPA